MKSADRLVLDALHREARNWMTNAQWAEVVDAVEKAGGVREVQGFAREVLAKAARQSFGGNRSAAGAYAASIRWGNRGANGGASTAGHANGSTGGGEDEEFDGTHGTAMKEGQAARNAIGLAVTSRGIETGNDRSEEHTSELQSH